MNISICGIEHEIIECEDTFGKDTNLGEIEYGKCLIRINKNIPLQLKKSNIMPRDFARNAILYWKG